MRNKIFAIVGVIAIISTIFASCSSSKNNNDEITTADNYGQNVNEYVLEEIEVLDENGNPVLDENGNILTSQVVQKVENSGNDNNNNDGFESNNSGNEITIGKLTTQATTLPVETTVASTANNTTEKEITTLPADKNIVPLTTDSGKPIDFSAQDQQIIKQMLEVPYMYESNYENTDGVPIALASHAAIWSLQRNGLSTNTFPEGTVVLNLFKFFGQTVVNYSNRCNNESSNQNIIFVNEKNADGTGYNKMFLLTQTESNTHTITIDHIEDLGNNNYYKVVAKVSGVKGYNTVNAIIQRNKLDSSLGFSIKALKWS